MLLRLPEPRDPEASRQVSDVVVPAQTGDAHGPTPNATVWREMVDGPGIEQANGPLASPLPPSAP